MDLAVSLTLVAVLGALSQWLAWRVQLPAIVFLLGFGLALGPLLGWLDPDQMFGPLLFPIVSLAVAVILFEGSLRLRFQEIEGLGRVLQRLITLGAGVVWGVMALAAHYLAGLDWPLAILFGALLVVTGPTVIIPLLRAVRLKPRLAHILRWEGILIDPIGALMAVLVFEFTLTQATGSAMSHTLAAFGASLVAGSMTGLGGGILVGALLKHRWVPDYLHQFVTLATVLGVFTLADALAAESGLLAVTLMGIWLANRRDVPIEGVLDFKEHLTLLLVSGLFILLAARVEWRELQAVALPGLLLLAVLLLVAQPLKALAATWRQDFRWQEVLMLAWIGPRGIVAAAVTSLFALKLTEAGYTSANQLVPLMFIIIIGTVLIPSLTARLLARQMGVAEPEPRGVLILGANPLARAVAGTLARLGFPVLLADSSYDEIRAARMAGLPTYFGDALSGMADRRLDLVGFGTLLGLSMYPERNRLAALKYRREFGPEHVFRLPAAREPEQAQEGLVLFGQEQRYEALKARLDAGGLVKHHALTEGYALSQLEAQYAGAIWLCVIDPRGRLRPLLAEHGALPLAQHPQARGVGPGWTVISLIVPGESETGPARTEATPPKTKPA